MPLVWNHVANDHFPSDIPLVFPISLLPMSVNADGTRSTHYIFSSTVQFITLFWGVILKVEALDCIAY